MARYDFASDNTAPAAPEAMAAIVAANSGFASGYGSDTVSARAADLVRGLLDADADVRFVTSGTAANAICCATLCQPFEAVLAHEHAHIATDETGAPGFFGHGLRIAGLPGPSGKIDPSGLAAPLAAPDQPHWQSPAALSLTNATEYGTVYSADALQALIAPVKARGYGVHLDGARLANAAAAGFDLKAIKTLGVDLLVIGGTKAGMTPTEAIVLFDKSLTRRFDARLKQGGQLPSKGRFYAAPFIGMLEDGAFVRHAGHANGMARRLAEAMPFRINHPVEANAVFVEMDEARLAALHAAGWFVYRFLDGSVRFMCSWATTESAVDELADALRRIA
ncbi:MAG: low specificity L-threonine aldolase [Alphaproteobacteria bacterium]|nr:low specificity L-threonine aldolase [Alphaproteobacteria bacterium]MBU1513348.1 low specificity L-threonine aldolase [Alphaproteobacteria bacterium]MBU2096340.1 low specificity L-threonine aldolase [Alphaproteobacteria bacterium]MBU2149968.1 low specificity L-threonine aldolase [Alphaproteobacteria bacterium]MBU2309834.1 low specificity L-threonine aldolase [Alphaproteobacteria bacterium]